MVDYRSLFKMPTRVTITARSSSITNSFINGIAPTIEPTAEQVKDALNALGMEDGHIECAYCGDPCTEWDHLNPLVRNKMPTGYITEINNLVPACGKCNQSKGNKPWREWMVSDAAQSPKSRGVVDLNERMQMLADYEELFTPVKVDFEKMLGKEMWERYWKACDELQDFMRHCQILQDAASAMVEQKLRADNASDIPTIVTAPAENPEPKPVDVHPASKVTKVPDGTNWEPSLEDRGMISDIVKKRVIPNLKALKLDNPLVSQLESQIYCHSAFGISFPLLQALTPSENASAAAKDNCGHNRYWVRPILIDGKRYLVCSQWYDRHRDALLYWLSSQGW
jgi:hypothetical protein